MDTKTKVIAALMVVMVAAGGVILLPTVSADESPAPPGDGRGGHLFWRRVPIWRWVINNGIPETLEGEASTFKRCILVLEVQGEPVNVVIPGFWTVGDEVMNTEELLDGDPFGMGDTMTIETLMVELVKETHTVKSYFAYTIQVDEVKATALLPFNIET
jgi:hypothetical protein